MSSSAAAIDAAATSGRAALVGYLPAGFPDLPTSLDAVRAMVDGHAIGKSEHNDWEHNSMPSGHTAGAVAVSLALGREVDGAAVPAAMAAGAVAAVQPIAGNHYFSDVAVGAAIGWAAEAATGWVFDRWLPARKDGQLVRN